MIRALRDPRWLAGLAVAVAFAVVCVLLAQWQLDRRIARADRNAAVIENFDSRPLPLADVMDSDGSGRRGAAGTFTSGNTLPPGQEWQPVRLRGTYEVADTVLVRNRPQGGSNGYLVAVPFRLAADDGTPPPVDRVLLVRGWVAAGASAAEPEAVPPPPPGEVDVVARLRPSEVSSDRAAPAGQAYRLDVASLLGGPLDLTGTYGVVAQESGVAPTTPVPVPRPDTDPGPHLAYGVQWYLFALTGLVIWVVLARRHAGEQDEQRASDDEAEATTSSATSSTRSREWVYDPGR